MPIAELGRQYELSPATSYKMKARCCGVDLSDAKRLKKLVDKNSKRKRLVADMMLANFVLKDLLGKS